MKTITAVWKKISHPEFNGIPPLLTSRHLSSLDGLRALSIILVILSHCFYGTRYGKYANGHSGVCIFFVISGFLITTLLIKERITTGEISLKRFYIRRCLRIFPVAYLFLFTLIILNRIFQLNISSFNFITTALYLKNLTFLYPVDNWQVGHFWSLAIEEQFYLLFPFIMVYNFKLYIRLVIVFILGAPVLNMLFYHGGGVLAQGSPHFVLRLLMDIWGRGTSFILCGSLCSILLFKGMIPVAFLEKFKGAALYLLLLLLLMDTRGILDFPGKEVINLYFFAPGLCIVVLLGLYKGNSFSFTFLNNPLVRTIGVLSYSLYVWQQLFTSQQPWANAFRYGAAAWFNLPILGLVAYLSYHLFEKKFLRLKDRFAVKAGPAQVASAQAQVASAQAVENQGAPPQASSPGHHSMAL